MYKICQLSSFETFLEQLPEQIWNKHRKLIRKMKDYLGLTVLYRIVRMTQAALRTVAQPNKHVRQKKNQMVIWEWPLSNYHPLDPLNQ